MKVMIHKSLTRKTRTVLLCAMPVFVLCSCGQDPTRKYHQDQKHTSPRIEYTAAMDMYQSPSYETYSGNPVFKNGISAQTPPEGTIARGNMPYAFPHTNEGYEMAGQKLRNPISLTPEILEEGKVLYSKYCTHCHGTSGMGDGKMVKNDRFPPPPAYSSPQLKDLPEGKMYHSITLGRNLMPSHASQLYPEERWKIIHYIQTLQGPKEGTPPAAGEEGNTGEAQADSTQNG